jgi:hypothetical protein
MRLSKICLVPFLKVILPSQPYSVQPTVTSLGVRAGQILTSVLPSVLRPRDKEISSGLG